jgi:hypothetical protein
MRLPYLQEIIMQLHNTLTRLLTITSLAILSNAANAQTFTSSEQRVNLVELYTSEGCSSCPPAERWVNALRDNNALWSEFIPLAFHVDYWDYIGWQDPFANKAYSQRQRLYADQGNIRSVYTPGMLLNGKEWRGWSRTRAPKRDKTIAGQLAINIDQTSVSASYATKNTLQQSLTLNIALLGFDQSSEVTAGENGGKNFNHNFVVLAYRTINMQATDTGFKVNTADLPTSPLAKNSTAIAAWVNATDNLAPLQAVGGWLVF